MRHKSIKTTVDDYGNWLPAEQPGALREFAAALLGRGHLVDTRKGGLAVNLPEKS